MQLPPKITPSSFRAELLSTSCYASNRALRLARDKGTLPKLQTRGKGRRQGKLQFWRSPRLLEHARAEWHLRKLGYPNDEARLILWWTGFPITPEAVRSAWLSRLGKIQLRVESQSKLLARRKGHKVLDVEDELSELAKPFIKALRARFALPESLIRQAVVDLFGFVFRHGYLPEVNLLIDLMEIVSVTTPIRIDENHILSEGDFCSMVQFIKRTMSFEVVQGIVSVATDSDLTHAHRRWRSILSLAQRIVPEIAAENEFARFLAAGFGRVCSPLIIRWIRDGKTKQLDDSLSEITKFMDGHDLRGILTCGILGKKICEPDIAALSGLVLKLRKIWDYSGFPFSYSAS